MLILKINKRNFKKIIETAVKLIKQEKVIICPTDTVYGLVADAGNKRSVEKVFLIKKRAINNPAPIFIKDIKMAKKFAHINKRQQEFLKSVWPGKVTAILKRKKTKIKIYGINKDSIALRIPNFKPINFLLEKLHKPLIGTSANVSGKPASGNFKKVMSQFKDKKFQPDLIIDAGNLKPGKPSTILDLTILLPKILRQ